MSRKYKFHEKNGAYFVSFATVNWIDVFTRDIYFAIMTQPFQRQIKIDFYYGYELEARTSVMLLYINIVWPSVEKLQTHTLLFEVSQLRTSISSNAFSTLPARTVTVQEVGKSEKVCRKPTKQFDRQKKVVAGWQSGLFRRK